jgi:hypothetical protein
VTEFSEHVDLLRLRHNVLALSEAAALQALRAAQHALEEVRARQSALTGEALLLAVRGAELHTVADGAAAREDAEAEAAARRETVVSRLAAALAARYNPSTLFADGVWYIRVGRHWYESDPENSDDGGGTWHAPPLTPRELAERLTPAE